MTKKEFDELHLQKWQSERDDDLRKHIEELTFNREMLKTAIGRLAQGWHLVVVPDENVDEAVIWLKPLPIRVLKIDMRVFETVDDTERQSNGTGFVFEDKDKAALFKTFFG